MDTLYLLCIMHIIIAPAMTDKMSNKSNDGIYIISMQYGYL